MAERAHLLDLRRFLTAVDVLLALFFRIRGFSRGCRLSSSSPNSISLLEFLFRLTKFVFSRLAVHGHVVLIVSGTMEPEIGANCTTSFFHKIISFCEAPAIFFH